MSKRSGSDDMSRRRGGDRAHDDTISQGAGVAGGNSHGATHPARDRLIGAVLEERYRIDSQLARGGMSTVYRGEDLRLGRQVAIKVMTQQYAADATFLARFEREARAAAALDDPHVVGVYDQGRDGDHVFLVMELVDGGTLRDLLREHKDLSVPVALSILEPILAALAAAHHAGLIHRDVKPENVLISSRGDVLVADFGLVRAVASTTIATGDVILGTVAYLSPEQVETGASDERSDVYSAGIVAFEMLTGHAPFGGENALSVAYQHVHSDVPEIANEAPGVPDGIAAAIDAATSRDSLDRPANAAEFLRRIRDARADIGLSLVRVPSPPSPAGSSSPSTSKRPTSANRGTVVAARPDRLTAAEDASRSGDATRVQNAPPTTPPIYDDPPRSPRSKVHQARSSRYARRRWRAKVIGLIIIAVIAAAAAFGGWWLTSQWTSTPSVLNLPRDTAVSSIENADLHAVLTTAHNNVVPSGAVAALSPKADTRQRKGADVSLVISAGKPAVPIIKQGTPFDDAADAVRHADLSPTTSTDDDLYSSSVPAGAVLRTDPPQGTELRTGASVLLIRSLGPAPRAIPHVAGKLVEDAENKLLVAGFVLGPKKEKFDADVAPGTVIATMPPAEQTADYGAKVSLVLAVSKRVPNVVARDIDAAKATLETDGFDVTIGDPEFSDAISHGGVIRSVPPVGTRIDPAHPAVTLIGSTAMSVPDVEGMTVGRAKATLDNNQLIPTVHALIGGDSSLVTKQSPQAGTLAAPHSIVQLRAWP